MIELKTLGDISESIVYGVTASANDEPVGPKFLRITDIQDGTVDWNSVPWCVCDKKKSIKNRLQTGDIVFARTGATTGKSFLIAECPDDTVFASYLIRVRLGKTAVPNFVSHFFQTPDYWEQITRSSRGVAQPGVNATTLKSLQIPLPPLAEQKRIAGILDAADALRAKRRQTLTELDTLIQSTFLDMFGDPVANSGNWPVKHIQDLSELVINGTTPKGGKEVYVDSGYTFFRSQNVWRNELKFDDIAYIDEATHASMKKSHLKHLDILISKTGRINTENSSLGRAALFEGKDGTANINGHVYLIRLKPEVSHRFILAILTSNIFREHIRKVSVGAIDKRQLNKGHIEGFPIIYPPKDQQIKFVSIVEHIKKLQVSYLKELKELDTLFSSLQSRAFKGDL